MWNILQVSDLAYPHIGGTEKIVLKYSQLLQELGNRVEILTTKIPGTENTEILDKIRIRRLNKFLFFFSGFEKLNKGMDIIHSHSYLSSISLSFFKKINKKKLVIRHVHDVYDERLESFTGWGVSGLVKNFEKYLVKGNYDCYIVPSKYTKNKLSEKGINPDLIEVLPHGIDFTEQYDPTFLRKKYNISENTRIIGFVGRLSRGKGPQYLVNAMPEILKNLDAVLVLVGPNPDKRLSGIVGIEEELKQRVKNLKLEKKVIFAGSVPDLEIPYYYYGFDLFVLPSVSEGFGLSVLESLNAGKPVVAFNSAALPELVVNKKNGVLVEPGDFASLQNSIIDILRDQKIYNQYSQFAHENVLNYRWEYTTAKLVNIYKKYLP